MHRKLLPLRSSRLKVDVSSSYWTRVAASLVTICPSQAAQVCAQPRRTWSCALGPEDTFDFRLFAESTGYVLCRVGMDMTFRYVSPSSVRVLGWKPEEMIGQAPGAFVHPEDVPALAAALTLGLHAGIEFAPLTLRMQAPNQAIACVEVTSRILRCPDSAEALEILLILRDATARTVMEDQLFALALTDGLTGLSNRRGFDLAFNREWKRTLREQSEMSLLLIDLDHFKQFNDEHGHQAGDDCLRTVAAALSACVHRATDTIARYGGEEIAIVLPSTTAAGARDMAECVRARVHELRIPHEGNPEGDGFVSVSVGVGSVVPEDGAPVAGTSADLFVCADAALYEAKRKGRNRVAANILFHSGLKLKDADASQEHGS